MIHNIGTHTQMQLRHVRRTTTTTTYILCMSLCHYVKIETNKKESYQKTQENQRHGTYNNKKCGPYETDTYYYSISHPLSQDDGHNTH